MDSEQQARGLRGKMAHKDKHRMPTGLRHPPCGLAATTVAALSNSKPPSTQSHRRQHRSPVAATCALGCGRSLVHADDFGSTSNDTQSHRRHHRSSVAATCALGCGRSLVDGEDLGSTLNGRYWKVFLIDSDTNLRNELSHIGVNTAPRLQRPAPWVAAARWWTQMTLDRLQTSHRRHHRSSVAATCALGCGRSLVDGEDLGSTLNGRDLRLGLRPLAGGRRRPRIHFKRTYVGQILRKVFLIDSDTNLRNELSHIGVNTAPRLQRPAPWVAAARWWTQMTLDRLQTSHRRHHRSSVAATCALGCGRSLVDGEDLGSTLNGRKVFLIDFGTNLRNSHRRKHRSPVAATCALGCGRSLVDGEDLGSTLNGRNSVTSASTPLPGCSDLRLGLRPLAGGRRRPRIHFKRTYVGQILRKVFLIDFGTNLRNSHRRKHRSPVAATCALGCGRSLVDGEDLGSTLNGRKVFLIDSDTNLRNELSHIGVNTAPRLQRPAPWVAAARWWTQMTLDRLQTSHRRHHRSSVAATCALGCGRSLVDGEDLGSTLNGRDLRLGLRPLAGGRRRPRIHFKRTYVGQILRKVFLIDSDTNLRNELSHIGVNTAPRLQRPAPWVAAARWWTQMTLDRLQTSHRRHHRSSVAATCALGCGRSLVDGEDLGSTLNGRDLRLGLRPLAGGRRRPRIHFKRTYVGQILRKVFLIDSDTNLRNELSHIGVNTAPRLQRPAPWVAAARWWTQMTLDRLQTSHRRHHRSSVAATCALGCGRSLVDGEDLGSTLNGRDLRLGLRPLAGGRRRPRIHFKRTYVGQILRKVFLIDSDTNLRNELSHIGVNTAPRLQRPAPWVAAARWWTQMTLDRLQTSHRRHHRSSVAATCALGCGRSLVDGEDLGSTLNGRDLRLGLRPLAGGRRRPRIHFKRTYVGQILRKVFLIDSDTNLRNELSHIGVNTAPRLQRPAPWVAAARWWTQMTLDRLQTSHRRHHRSSVAATCALGCGRSLVDGEDLGSTLNGRDLRLGLRPLAGGRRRPRIHFKRTYVGQILRKVFLIDFGTNLRNSHRRKHRSPVAATCALGCGRSLVDGEDLGSTLNGRKVFLIDFGTNLRNSHRRKHRSPVAATCALGCGRSLVDGEDLGSTLNGRKVFLIDSDTNLRNELSHIGVNTAPRLQRPAPWVAAARWWTQMTLDRLQTSHRRHHRSSVAATCALGCGRSLVDGEDLGSTLNGRKVFLIDFGTNLRNSHRRKHRSPVAATCALGCGRSLVDGEDLGSTLNGRNSVTSASTPLPGCSDLRLGLRPLAGGRRRPRIHFKRTYVGQILRKVFLIDSDTNLRNSHRRKHRSPVAATCALGCGRSLVDGEDLGSTLNGRDLRLGLRPLAGGRRRPRIHFKRTYVGQILRKVFLIDSDTNLRNELSHIGVNTAPRLQRPAPWVAAARWWTEKTSDPL
ncbi:hypothetical protein R3P38DRAFT_2798004 [Favolaschia claudopus]|uniref:Uncharacterized protein n=1 Tax=Favolaschia claudopus TaxID=2862362 RepID=A0AAW0A1V5_9AGAR